MQVHHLARLFDDLKPEIAERMVAIWSKTGPVTGRKPVYESALYDDERRGVRPQSAPTARRSLTGREDLPARHRGGR